MLEYCEKTIIENHYCPVNMKAAKGRVIITPPTGTPIGGNVRTDNKSRGVHDDLYCNILILNDGKTV